jgi:hypothetical protein
MAVELLYADRWTACANSSNPAELAAETRVGVRDHRHACAGNRVDHGDVQHYRLNFAEAASGYRGIEKRRDFSRQPARG